MKNYDDYTYNSKNIFARYAHRSRFNISVSKIKTKKNISLLDFGCGDGNYLNSIKLKSNNNTLIGFEPYMKTKEELDNLVIYNKWDDIKNHCKQNGLFDYVTCFEVMEHFSEKRELENLKKISSVLNSSGTLIISVPIEKGFITLIKNLRRVSISYSKNKNIYSFKNIFYSFLGLKTESLKNLRLGDEYLGHMGFYFDDFEKVLNQDFIITEKRFSPFDNLTHHLNSQVFYTLKKNNRNTKIHNL